VLRCPNCGWAGEELLDQETADRFDDEIERGTDHLLALLAVVTELNMREYADRFAAALQADAILPEDF
jgi:hypothetical protein